ncbi:hypothetical protein BX667DRAFT_507070 [Coemansia mojavensis]|nr:hypothetical protein BX667DRAFT_507070 [Coemansia mojavensis]
MTAVAAYPIPKADRAGLDDDTAFRNFKIAVSCCGAGGIFLNLIIFMWANRCCRSGNNKRASIHSSSRSHSSSDSKNPVALQLDSILNELKTLKEAAEKINKEATNEFNNFNRLAMTDPARNDSNLKILDLFKELRKVYTHIMELCKNAHTLVGGLDSAQRESEEIKKLLNECNACKDEVKDFAVQTELDFKMFDIFPAGWSEFLDLS